MSQVKLRTFLPDGRPVEVVGGWDRPVAGYHFTVFVHPDTDEEEALYDSIPFGLPDNEGYKAAAAGLGLDLPNTFWSLCDRQEGNTIYYVTPLGEVVQAINL